MIHWWRCWTPSRWTSGTLRASWRTAGLGIRAGHTWSRILPPRCRSRCRGSGSDPAPTRSLHWTPSCDPAGWVGHRCECGGAPQWSGGVWEFTGKEENQQKYFFLAKYNRIFKVLLMRTPSKNCKYQLFKNFISKSNMSFRGASLCWQHGQTKSTCTCTYIGEGFTGANGVTEAHPVLVVGVLSPGQDVLVTSEVGLLVQNPAATLHLDGVAAAEVRLSVGTVAVALESAALEVSFLVEDDLQRGFTSLESLLIVRIFKKWRMIFVFVLPYCSSWTEFWTRSPSEAGGLTEQNSRTPAL